MPAHEEKKQAVVSLMVIALLTCVPLVSHADKILAVLTGKLEEVETSSNLYIYLTEYCYLHDYILKSKNNIQKKVGKFDETAVF